jgi:heme-degrading monooxygenase HmoA
MHCRARGVRRLCDIPLRRNAFRQHLLNQKRDPPPEPPPPIQGPLARVATATVRPHAVDALKTQYAALFSDDGAYAGTPGFRGSILLVDEHKNSAQSITLWQDRAAFDALAATDAYRESMGALAQHCFNGVPEVAEFAFAGAFFPDDGPPS